MAKWTKKVLRHTKTIILWVKDMKVAAKCCLNWGFFVHDEIFVV